MPFSEDENRQYVIEMANGLHGRDLTVMDLAKLRAFMDGSTQEHWRASSEPWVHEVRAEQHGVVAENLTVADMCFIAAAHGAMRQLIVLAEEALEVRRSTPAFQPRAKVGDTVWTTRYGIVQDDGGERNIGYEVLVEERKIEEIVWDGSRFSYVVFRGLEETEALNDAELDVARDLDAAIAAQRAKIAAAGARESYLQADSFIRAREEVRNRSYQ